MTNQDLSPFGDTAARLAEQEAIIERGLKSFVEVGTALSVVRDEGLYKEDYATFEDYCADRWQLSRAHAYRMIEGAETVLLLGDVEILPTKESHARALAKAPEDIRAEVWTTVLDETDNSPTADAIVGVIEKLTGIFADNARDDEENEPEDEPQNFDTLMTRLNNMTAEGATSEEIKAEVEQAWNPTSPLDPVKDAKKVLKLASDFLKAIDRLPKDVSNIDTAMTYWSQAVTAVEAVADRLEDMSRMVHQAPLLDD